MSEHKRTNYLVDRPFQLKATLLIVALTLAVGAPLGFLLLRNAGQAIEIGREAVDLGQSANAVNAEAVKQAELLNKRLEMEAMLHLSNDPKALADVKAANARETERIVKEAETTKAQAALLAKQRDALERTRKALLFSVTGGIAALVLLVSIAGILFTHKVAGPVHRMRQLFREVSAGRFSPHRPLRKGDELQEMFADFSAMVVQLEQRQAKQIEHLSEAIERASKAGVSDASLGDLRVVRDAMAEQLASKREQSAAS